MFRYWDGTSWSEIITANPLTPPPAAGGFSPAGSAAGTGQSTWTPHSGATGADPWVAATGQGRTGQETGRGGRRGSAGPWLILAAAVVALVVLIFFVIRGVSGVIANNDQATNPTTNPCPVQTSDASPVAHPNDGRVHGGQLSFPMLASPWSAVQTDSRVPFGRDTAMQSIITEPNYQPGSQWMASILVSELVAGDGFYSPQEGSEIVVKCLLGVFYGDAKVDRDDTVNKAMTLDGKDAWIVETNLSFSIKGLQATGELVIVVIVATSAESSSLFYASIPDNVPQYVPDARTALAGLRVTG